MTESAERFCPRCGTPAIAGMPFCAKCGLELSGAVSNESAESVPVPVPIEPGVKERGRSSERAGAPDERRWDDARRSVGRDLGPFLIVAAIVLVVGGAALVLLNTLISGPRPPGGPAGQPGGIATAVPVLTAAPTGLTILSPPDGSVIRTRNLTVIGTAPAGLRVVRDITFGLDMSTVVDGTGHWALSFELAEGTNDLTFRLGDDRSTAQRIRVTYVEAPAAEPTPTQAMGSAPAIPTVGLPSMTPVIPDATPAPGATLAPGASIPPGQVLAILDPPDGATLSNRSQRISGIAPPGARIVQDISFALDRSTTADAAGRWAIEVELRDGENLLTFRIGDDQSTKRTLRLIYQPPP